MIYQIASFACLIIACITILLMTFYTSHYLNNRKTVNEIYLNAANTDDPEKKDNLDKVVAMYEEENDSLKKKIAIWAVITFVSFFAAFAFQSAYEKSDHHLRKEAEKQMLINRKIEEISRENNR